MQIAVSHDTDARCVTLELDDGQILTLTSGEAVTLATDLLNEASKLDNEVRWSMV